MNQSPTKNSARLFRIAIILASALLGLLVAQFINTRLPKQYRSSVTMQIPLREPTLPFGPPLDREKPLAKEIQRIQTKEILYPVIESLHLEQRWPRHSSLPPKEDAFQSLLTKIRISEFPDTQLAQVSVTSTDPNEAAETANAIASEYYRYQKSTRSEASVPGFFPAEKKAIERQRQKTEDLRKIASAIRQAESETDQKSGLLDESLEPTNGSPKYIEAQKNYLQARKLLEEMERKLLNKIIEMHIPSQSPIWERAEPSAIPLSTPSNLRLTLGALLGAIIGFILSLFIRR